MTTITVQVDNEQNAQLLEKMLKALSFVEGVDVKNQQPTIIEVPRGSYQRLKKAIDRTEGDLMFKDINDPSKCQSDLRDEWKRSI